MVQIEQHVWGMTPEGEAIIRYTLRNDMLETSRDNLRILHPLPRVNEIAYDVDENPKAYYFDQARNGLYARQALICRALGIKVI